MQKTQMAAALAAALACSGAAGAAAIEDELAAIKARLAQLEKQVQDQNRVIQEKDRQIAALVTNPSTPAPDGGGWADRVALSGLVEVEAGYSDPYAGDSGSDVVVATVELGLAAQVNDWVAANVTLLYEEDETDLEVDVATVGIAPPDGHWFVVAGQDYLPFGTYETHLVSDPLTLEIGETRETNVLAGVSAGGFTGAVYVFNGESDKDDETIDRFGAVAGYGQAGEDGGFAVDVGYINHIGDADALQDAIGGNVDDYVGGISVDGTSTAGPFTLIGEYTAATDSFQAAELAFDGAGAEPRAWNLEAAYGFALAGRDATFAIAWQGTEEALALELPETRLAAALSVAVMDGTTVSLEWAHDDDYAVADGGTGEEADTLTAQLAVEF